MDRIKISYIKISLIVLIITYIVATDVYTFRLTSFKKFKFSLVESSDYNIYVMAIFGLRATLIFVNKCFFGFNMLFRHNYTSSVATVHHVIQTLART